MKRSQILGLVILSLILSVGHADQTPAYRDGYLLVKFADTGLSSTSEIARQQILDSTVGTGSCINQMYSAVPGLSLVKLKSGANVQSALSALSAAGGILYAEPDYFYKAQATPNVM